MNWCEPRNIDGVNPEDWRDLSLPIDRRRGQVAAAQTARARSGRRRVARTAAGWCADGRVPMHVEIWGIGDADA
jgi:hypothetical protein